jgi:hypothetical protein
MTSVLQNQTLPADFTIWFTSAFSGIVTLSGAKGLPVRFFAFAQNDAYGLTAI